MVHSMKNSTFYQHWEKLGEPIGKGRTAEVYAIGEDKVLKLFYPFISFESIKDEMIHTHAAYMSKVPVADVYEIVRAGDRYGLLMEREEGSSLDQFIYEYPEKRVELISRFAKAVKVLHKIPITDPGLPDAKELAIYYIGKLNKEYCSEEDAKKIRSIFESIPEAQTFVHCDCHTGNAHIVGEEIRYLDLMFSGKGHPVFDLLAMYAHFVFLPSFSSKEDYKTKSNMTQVEAETLFDRFLEKYFSKADTEKLSGIKTVVRGVHAAQICLASVRMPGVFTEDMLLEVRRRALEFSEQYHVDDLNIEMIGWNDLV